MKVYIYGGIMILKLGEFLSHHQQVSHTSVASACIKPAIAAIYSVLPSLLPAL
jgi:hypothetical protein